MKYTYSICHIDSPEIEYKNEIIDGPQVVGIVQNYPWEEELRREEEIIGTDLHHYSPSLNFTNVHDQHSFCLTAVERMEDVSFLVFYERPVLRKVLFGLMGEKEKLDVIDKWFEKEKAMTLLRKFLSQEYSLIEEEMIG